MKKFKESIFIAILCLLIFFNFSYAENTYVYDYRIDSDFLGTFRLYSENGRIWDFNSGIAFRKIPQSEYYKLAVDKDKFEEFCNSIEMGWYYDFYKMTKQFSLDSNGKYTFTDKLFKYREIDREALCSDIAQKIALNDYTLVKIPIINNEMNSEMQDVVQLSTFTTYYNTGQYNRSSNIRVGGSHIGGTKVEPGVVFSFNSKTGEVSYKMLKAPVIEGEKYVMGLGGGLCQVSTTLFNAVLESGLEIVTRNNHSYAQAYVKRGRDAMVSSWSDFKFKNNFEHDIYIIYKQVQNNSITFEIYGNSADKKKVKTYVTGGGSSFALHREIDGMKDKVFYSSYGN